MQHRRHVEGRLDHWTAVLVSLDLLSAEDHSVQFLATYLPDGAMSGLVVNLACTAQAETSGRQVSADFWHETRAELRRRFGDGLFVLTQVSAAGDQDDDQPFGRCLEGIMALGCPRPGFARNVAQVAGFAAVGPAN